MSNIHDLKESITEKTKKEALNLILDIRKDRREEMKRAKKSSRGSRSRSSSSKKDVSKKQIMNDAKKLSSKEKKEILKLLKNKDK